MNKRPKTFQAEIMRSKKEKRTIVRFAKPQIRKYLRSQIFPRRRIRFPLYPDAVGDNRYTAIFQAVVLLELTGDIL